MIHHIIFIDDYDVGANKVMVIVVGGVVTIVGAIYIFVEYDLGDDSGGAEVAMSMVVHMRLWW